MRELWQKWYDRFVDSLDEAEATMRDRLAQISFTDYFRSDLARGGPAAIFPSVGIRKTADAIFGYFDDLKAIAKRVFIEVIGEAFTAALAQGDDLDDLNTRVIKASEVFSAIAGPLVEFGAKVISDPFDLFDSEKAVISIYRKSALIKFVFGFFPSSLATWIEGKLLFPALTAIISVIELIATISAAFGVGAALVLLRSFCSGQLIAFALGQFAPRKRVRLIGGGSVKRRMPGGNPP